MNNKLFIPKTIRVGFVKRTDTFAGKLGYVMYYDEKGKLRQEVSCDVWRDKNIDCIDYENTPRNNYVLNTANILKMDVHITIKTPHHKTIWLDI